PARARVRAGGARTRFFVAPHPAASPDPERARARDRGRDARHRQHDRARGGSVVPRSRCIRADTDMGQHGRRGSRLSAACMVARHVPRTHDRIRRPCLQPGRRWTARRARPAPEVLMPLLEVTDLRTYFHTDQGMARAVDGVSFTVEKGEVLGIVGESGSGKSVTALSLLQLVATPPGEIMEGSSVRFDGRELLDLSAREMRAVRGNDIAMIFQEPMTSLNPVYTVGDQIAEAVRLHRDVSRKEARAQAIRMLRLVGIPSPEERVDAYPHQLSGGQRQRVMIAVALSCEPDLLVADEPTTALDVTIQAQILELVAGLRERLGMAVILITHDLGVVAEVCDRVIVMYGGQ